MLVRSRPINSLTNEMYCERANFEFASRRPRDRQTFRGRAFRGRTRGSEVSAGGFSGGRTRAIPPHRSCRLAQQIVSSCATDPVALRHRSCRRVPRIVACSATDRVVLCHISCCLMPQIASSRATNRVSLCHRSRRLAPQIVLP